MSPRNRLRLGSAVLAALTVGWMAGCEPPAPGTLESVASLRDSAGVRIAESSAPMWATGDAWTLSAAPELEIGRGSTNPNEQFYRIVGAVRLEDGSIVVAMRGDNTLRFFDPSGTWVRTIGGTGDGPAEFRQLAGLVRVGDLIVAYESQGPVKWFDAAGAMTDSYSPGTFPLTIQGIFADGSVLARGPPPRVRLESAPAAEGRTVHHHHFTRGDRDGSIEPLGQLPNHETIMIDGVPALVRFRPMSAMVAVAEEGFYHAWPVNYDIKYYDMLGHLRGIVRRAWVPREVTAGDRDEVRRDLLAGSEQLSEDQQRRQRARAAALEFAETRPAHRSMVVDAEGNLWVELPLDEHGDQQVHWDVFSPGGEWLGQVFAPPRFAIVSVGSDYVLGVARDATEVEWIQVYALLKP